MIPATRDAHMAARLAPYTVEQVSLSGGQAGQAASTFSPRLPLVPANSQARVYLKDTR
jgi:hypothetical protein